MKKSNMMNTIKGQKKPDTTSLRGREAGTSTRSKSGKPMGSKAHRANKDHLGPGEAG